MHHMFAHEDNQTSLSRLDALSSPSEHLIHWLGPQRNSAEHQLTQTVVALPVAKSILPFQNVVDHHMVTVDPNDGMIFRICRLILAIWLLSDTLIGRYMDTIGYTDN
jgi:hypothetical protein